MVSPLYFIFILLWSLWLISTCIVIDFFLSKRQVHCSLLHLLVQRLFFLKFFSELINPILEFFFLSFKLLNHKVSQNDLMDILNKKFQSLFIVCHFFGLFIASCFRLYFFSQKEFCLCQDTTRIRVWFKICIELYVVICKVHRDIGVYESIPPTFTRRCFDPWFFTL